MTNERRNEAQKYAENIRDYIEELYNMTDEERERAEEESEETFESYISDALDVEYILNIQRQLIGVKVYVTIGGTNCYIDTTENDIICYWGGDEGRCYIGYEIGDTITEMFDYDF